MTIAISLFIFVIAFALGYAFKAWSVRHGYSGTIVVSEDKTLHKRVYSLELDDYPEKLEFKKVVSFKVDNSEESLDRE